MLVDLQQDWAAAVAAKLAADGFAPIERISTRTQFVTLGASLGCIIAHRDSDKDGVTTLRDRGPLASKVGFEGFGTGPLPPHTDRSGVTEPPALLLVVCEQKSVTGGYCTAVDGRAVYADLAACDPDVLDALSRSRIALFGGASGHLGSIFEPAQGGRIRIRYRTDGLVKYSPDIMRYLPVLAAAIKRHTILFGLEPGEGYVLHNHRWLHGRTAFTGDRVMYRLSLNPHPEFAIPSGFIRPDLPMAVAG
ncbi:TauD/TfdA family dioxygenase [Nocardia suismassiliense]|uniref:TauD/TfdA family dioxygenase n=1 Tax=Nocardia suismassiliense TaxID=2077092 RepID=UPI000D1F14F3|nr:TauD/TfdA family dioxygenase [Nocardia suismassiliense]